MKQKAIHKKTDEQPLVFVNSNIRICLVCGNHDIEFFEYGVSCEDCGTTFGRAKCLQN